MAEQYFAKDTGIKPSNQRRLPGKNISPETIGKTVIAASLKQAAKPK